MSIAARLFLLSALSVLGLLLLGGTGVYQLSSYNQKLAADLKDIGEGIEMMVEIERAQIAFKTQVQEWKNILVRGNRQEDFDKYQKQFGEEETKVQASLKKVIAALRADGATELAVTAEELAKEHLALGTRYREALKAYDTADRDAGHKVDQSVKGMDRPAAKGMDALVDKMEKGELEHLRKQAGAAQTTYETARNVLIAIFLVVVVGVVGFALYIIRRIRSSLASLRDTVEAIPRNWDLRLRVPLTGQDEITESGQAINALLASFQEVVGLIVDSARKTAQSCSHMAGSLREIDQAVGEQNDATSSVAAAIEQLTTSFEQIKTNANDSLAANSETTQSAVAGGRIISSASDGMTQVAGSVQSAAEVIERVGQQSREISTIVRVIREVADQTNLLALNAAIEAARAGEQGRGFAVVADEVRKLAEKTTGSAQEITRMIDAIQTSSTQAVTDVRKVVAQVDVIGKSSREAHGAIDAIRANTDKSEGFSRDISYALSEQSSASTLIAQQVEKIANMSEENTASVNHAKQSMLELEEEARTLQAAIARFSV